jgi:hypothetical protein
MLLNYTFANVSNMLCRQDYQLSLIINVYNGGVGKKVDHRILLFISRYLPTGKNYRQMLIVINVT